MRTRSSDHGASSVEFGLLLAAIAIVALPVLVVLGLLVKETLGDTCDGFADAADATRCTTSAGAGGTGGGGGGPVDPAMAAEAPARNWASAHYSPATARDIVCESVPVDPKPETTSECEITLDDGQTVNVIVTWTESGTTVTEAPA